jgi:hypothetical protein
MSFPTAYFGRDVLLCISLSIPWGDPNFCDFSHTLSAKAGLHARYDDAKNAKFQAFGGKVCPKVQIGSYRCPKVLLLKRLTASVPLAAQAAADLHSHVALPWIYEPGKTF